MNTNPDEATLALWLDDELTGDDLSAVEAWAMRQPQQLAAREEIRSWRAMIAGVLPATEEPPYPDFFNSRVLHAIRESAPPSQPVIKPKPAFWKAWFMPVTACCGMALAFWIGARSAGTPEYDVAGAPRAIAVDPVVYTPEYGVDAEWFASSSAAATVIVLSGVAAIPDATDFSETAFLPSENPWDSTAAIETPQ